MSFDRLRIRALSAMISAGLIVAACGKFGEREDPDLLLKYKPSAIGCLNDIGPVTNRYLAGQVTPEEWEKTCDCAIGSVEQFKRFVKPSAPEGYTREDLSSFIGKFLLTDFPDNRQLVESLFQLKAALIGGSAEAIAPAELRETARLIRILKEESLILLPIVAARVENPAVENLLRLADAINASGTRFAESLRTEKNRDFAWTEAQKFVTEAGKVLKWRVPDELIGWASAGKTMLFSGWKHGIEASTLPSLVKLASLYFGVAAAVAGFDSSRIDAPNAIADFYIQLAKRLRPALDDTLARHRGAIPLTEIDRVIDVLPSSWIPVDRMIVKRTLRPVVNTLLRSGTRNAIDRSVVDLIYDSADEWNESEIHLERIFQDMGASDPESSGVHPEEFLRVAESYAEKLDLNGQSEIERLKFLAEKFTPLHRADESEVHFTHLDRISMRGLSKMLSIRIGAEELMKAYASSAATRDRVDVWELKKLIDDIADMGMALHEIDTVTVPDAYARRFREADLFTLASNGDGYIDMDEGTYYLAYFFSGNLLAKRIRADLEPICQTQGVDVLNWRWMDASCFRRYFFGNFRDYWGHFPHLVAFYESLDDETRAKFEKAMEASSRFYGHSNKPVGSFDTNALVGLMHFMESLYLKFDGNGDQILDLPEIMRTYPVFKRTLAEIAAVDPKDDKMIEAILTYVVRYREPPSKSIGGIAKFLWWRSIKPFWKLDADRLGIYTVMAGLAGPMPGPETIPH